MGLIALAVIFTIAFFVWTFREIVDGFLGGILWSIVVLSLGGILCFLAILPSAFVSREYCIYELSKTNEIMALKDSENINGHIYLMGGYVSEDLYYYYAEQTENGIITNKIKANDCYIIYDENPRIEEYKATKFKEKWRYLYAIPAVEYYKIYVPQGTVTNEYEVDLE